ncbi:MULTISPECIES: 23S rRNA (adenine(2503)-C(2))-methyltransferase RlmN [Peptostreptococcus]|uniref:Probable dual-specificity RNA methyltransferase RlmN n=1 Tax=Peptostreptococcus anaerobius TaxID=1261 RepID=A0A135YWH1_9FIRM|nr:MULTISPECIES: 23S rRNA (adenine(2503)-C(2))-methyltransferase RlmN [Peptostreptococcus]KXB70504.1 23S rRNA methyltransferase [Peptostreptococcus anaerobius]KXI13754.1 23S rRNA methyltransferase [Peptostreptococcus anaerobius]MBS5596823.1 23S rRNA (adenine(2503)-C(2))-methyltransferase RlmN [Peptostreptococcus sp.]MDB8821829.1 23S rRNA (adenine(2503)-C(2))-methyltransferase RlmN [Peptostreptococcus anaerobius]MDB8826458.1 23S rRNA (adenine(2503)-C(2))-methyltransferase RlmN [Peptostreptococc
MNEGKIGKVVLKNLTEEEMVEFILSLGEKKFRAAQVYSWVYKNIRDFDEMKNVPKSLRDKLREKSIIGNLDIELKLESKIDNTKKYLFLLNDGNIIETVAMDYDSRLTVCVSNQVGCRMGCNFCASTIGGLSRHLEAWEILDQIMKVQEDLGKRVSNIVMMGSGEPLDNFDNSMRFLKLVNEKNGLNIGNRHITLSTCGLVDRILELADMQIPINLAISLHSPYDEERKEIMPIAKKYTIKELMDACRYYISKTNRRVTFEYALIKDKNNTDREAKKLVELLRGMLCHVNLIPINPIAERDYEKPNIEYINKFKNYLDKNRIPVSIRNSMGSDISGACGQLRRDYKETSKEE